MVAGKVLGARENFCTPYAGGNARNRLNPLVRPSTQRVGARTPADDAHAPNIRSSPHRRRGVVAKTLRFRGNGTKKKFTLFRLRTANFRDNIKMTKDRAVCRHCSNAVRAKRPNEFFFARPACRATTPAAVIGEALIIWRSRRRCQARYIYHTAGIILPS